MKMKKVATILANGFEEIEALTIVDVLRRAGIDCDLVGMEETVTGSHQITVEVDRLWNGDLSDYDGIFLPGGMPGAANLRDNPELIAAGKNHLCDLCSTNCLGACRSLKR